MQNFIKDTVLPYLENFMKPSLVECAEKPNPNHLRVLKFIFHQIFILLNWQSAELFTRRSNFRKYLRFNKQKLQLCFSIFWIFGFQVPTTQNYLKYRERNSFFKYVKIAAFKIQTFNIFYSFNWCFVELMTLMLIIAFKLWLIAPNLLCEAPV